MVPSLRARVGSCLLWTLAAAACGSDGQVASDALGDTSTTDIATTTPPDAADAPDVANEIPDIPDVPSDTDVDPGSGLLDEAGFAILPGRVLVRFTDGTSRADADAALTAAHATATTWLGPASTTAIGVIATYATPEGTAPLDALHAFEAALGADPRVADIARDYVLELTTERPPTDNEGLPVGTGRAFAIVGDLDAKRVFDACSYRLDPEDLFRELSLCIVDHDLLGARDATELQGHIASFEDLHTHATDEFCDTTPTGFQRPCEPNTTDHHGSAVASVTAARVNGTGMNGLLAGFQGIGFTELSAFDLTPRLRLFNVGHGARGSGLDILSGLEAAAKAGCTTVNLSMSSRESPLTAVRGFLALNRSFAALVDAYPATIFVVAAGNDHASLNGVAYWQSHRADNLIIVGATDDADAAATFSNFGQGKIDLAAPGVAVPANLVDVRHTGTVFHPTVETKVIDPVGVQRGINGTSFSSPLVASATSFLRAFEPALAPVAVKSRLRATAATIPAANLENRRLDFHQLVTDLVADRIATTATHLLTFDVDVSFAGDAACTTLDTGFGQPCLPVTLTADALAVTPNVRDMGGHVVVLTGTLAGGHATITFSGLAMTPGIGPAETTLDGTVQAVTGRPGDFELAGTVTGHSAKADGAPNDCTWTGTFTARLDGRRGP